SIVSVTARAPPLVSLAVVVPGPASSNGNLSFNVWARAEFPPASRRQIAISNDSECKSNRGFRAVVLEMRLRDSWINVGVLIICCLELWSMQTHYGLLACPCTPL